MASISGTQVVDTATADVVDGESIQPDRVEPAHTDENDLPELSEGEVAFAVDGIHVGTGE